MLNNTCLYFYKNHSEDLIWIVERYYFDCKETYINNPEEKLFSFDKNKIYDYNKDYPHNLTKDELDLFDKAFSDESIFSGRMRKKYLVFYKEKKSDKVFDVNIIFMDKDGNYEREFGKILFSFDKKTIYNYWSDYPNNLTKEEVELVDKYISPFRK